MNQGINGINANPYLGLNGFNNMGDLASNPYFLAALQSPNYNQMQANASIMNNQALQQQPQTDTFTPSSQNNVSFEGKSDSEVEEKKGNGKAWAILGTGAVVGLAILGRKAYKLGPEGADFFKRIGKGASTIWDDMCNTGKNLKGKITNNVKNNSQFSVRNINGKEVYTLPNHRGQVIDFRKGQNHETLLSDLGISLPEFDIKKVDIRKFNGKNIKIAGQDCTIDYHSGKIVKLLDSKGNDILAKVNNPTGEAEKAFAKEVKDYVQKVLNKNEDLISDLNVSYILKDKDIIYSWKSTEAPFTSPKLEAIGTNRYTAKANEVLQYLGKNKNADEAIQALRKNDPSKLKVATARYVNDGVTYYIKDGKIESINIPESVLENTAAGTYKIGTPAFDAYAYKNQVFMKNVLERKDNWTDVVYHLA